MIGGYMKLPSGFHEYKGQYKANTKDLKKYRKHVNAILILFYSLH